MRRGPVRTAFALITVLVMACVASASAVEPLWWKTVLRAEAGHVRFYAFAAASSRAAWVLGERIGRRGYARPVSYHWDGERRRSSALPSEPTYPRGEDVVGTRLSASGARNTWLLLPGEFGYAGEEPEECGLTPVPPEKRRADRPSRLLRWTGSGWEDSLTVEDAVLMSVVAVGSGGAWAFGEDLRGPVVFRYDGTKWTKKSGPVRVHDAEARGSEAWVVGESAVARRAGAWRFDGAFWRREQGVEGRQLISQAADGQDGRYAVGMRMSPLATASSPG
ncbi:hypothetical protein ABGB12_18685 [Actinocorallia sp. B10E7]|uniref:hypothetical protein n=1 Tax=Actinocorallia sp. B10E7 TaxID=3153558 RepID=UPI00325CC720